jgi:hypothetical protein
MCRQLLLITSNLQHPGIKNLLEISKQYLSKLTITKEKRREVKQSDRLYGQSQGTVQL